MWYYEQKSFLGVWSPVSSAEKPLVKDGWLTKSEGKICRVRYLQQVKKEHEHLSLFELYKIYTGQIH